MAQRGRRVDERRARLASTFPLGPPLIPDGRISRVRLAAVAGFPKEPSHTKRSLSTRLHTPLLGMVISLARHVKPNTLKSGSESGSIHLTVPTTHREPLCPMIGVTVRRNDVQHRFRWHYPSFIAPTGSCASPNPSGRLWLSLVRPVFAGCYEPLLEDGPSRRYLCGLCKGAWARTPPRPSSAFVRFFLLGIGLSLGSRRSTRETIPQTASHGASISGLQPFANVQAPLLAWPANCSDRGTLCSSRPPGRIHRAELASLPRASTGITTCPNPDN